MVFSSFAASASGSPNTVAGLGRNAEKPGDKIEKKSDGKKHD
jgi:hypothetical protein